MAHTSVRPARADIYTRITADIAAAIQHGAGEWEMPWHHDGSSIARPRGHLWDATQPRGSLLPARRRARVQGR
jgi:antirestriction protein ArdC